MFGSLVLGFLAGAAAPYAEPHIKRAVENVALAEAPLTRVELRLFAFGLCLLGAAILAALVGEASAVALVLGGTAGVFAPRAIDRYKARDRDDEEA